MDSRRDVLNYVVYMIGGSYFTKTNFLSPHLEKRLRIKYVETKQNIQLDLESKCIEFVENTLLPRLPKEVWNQTVDVKITTSGVWFLGASYALHIKAKYHGNVIDFSYEAGRKLTEAAS